MSVAQVPHYTTNLSKAQALIPETLELLGIWEPGMTATQLKAAVKASGALGRATDTRITDVVSRGFAQRYLVGNGSPAAWLKRAVASGLRRSALKQIMLIYTARHNRVLHDFITAVYWRRCGVGTGEITKAETRDFLERAVAKGHIDPRWSDSMMERVTRYLLGTLEDFGMIKDNRHGRRQSTPPTILPETSLFLAHELHQVGAGDAEITRHPDWGLFGLSPKDVLESLQREAARGHFQVQDAGKLLRIEWKYPDMDQLIDAIAH